MPSFVTKKVPRLRFREFTDDWLVKRFDEVFNIGAGGDVSSTHMRKFEDDTFKYPIYANSEKNNGLYGYSDIYKEEENCITVTGRGALGVAVARHQPFYPIVRLLTLRSKQNGNIDFFENLINKVNFFIESTGVPQLTGPQISSYKITVPSLDEQKRIAGFLKAVDEKIGVLQKKVDLLQAYKKGAMQALFSQEIRFKDEIGKSYPDWRKQSFGQDYSFLRTNSLSRSVLQDTGQIKNIHYGDIHTKLNSNFDSSREKLSFLSYIDKSDYCEAGDLIIADASEDRKDVGKSIEIIKIHGDRIVSGLHTFLARPDKTKMAIGFGGYLMQTQEVNRQLHRIATGASVLGISKTELSKIIITLPTKVEQQKIVNILTGLDDKIKLEESKLEQAKKFKKALLQQMFI